MTKYTGRYILTCQKCEKQGYLECSFKVNPPWPVDIMRMPYDPPEVEMVNFRYTCKECLKVKPREV